MVLRLQDQLSAPLQDLYIQAQIFSAKNFWSAQAHTELNVLSRCLKNSTDFVKHKLFSRTQEKYYLGDKRLVFTKLVCGKHFLLNAVYVEEQMTLVYCQNKTLIKNTILRLKK